MTKKEHKQRHVELHHSLDELVADFILYNREILPSKATVMELMSWSHEQAINPIAEE